jgi:hypothetical protein
VPDSYLLGQPLEESRTLWAARHQEARAGRKGYVAAPVLSTPTQDSGQHAADIHNSQVLLTGEQGRLLSLSQIHQDVGIGDPAGLLWGCFHHDPLAKYLRSFESHLPRVYDEHNQHLHFQLQQRKQLDYRLLPLVLQVHLHQSKKARHQSVPGLLRGRQRTPRGSADHYLRHPAALPQKTDLLQCHISDLDEWGGNLIHLLDPQNDQCQRPFGD